MTYNMSSEARVAFCEPVLQGPRMANPPDTLGSRIRAARKRKNLTQAKVASHFKISVGAVGNWEIDANPPESDKLPELARLLGETIDYLMTGQRSSRQANEADDTNVSGPVEIPTKDSGSRLIDVPVFGTVLGGKESDFLILDETIEYVRRLPGIMGKSKVYALYVQGDSMAPWQESGDLIYVDPNQPPRIGDYVVIQLKQARDSDPRQAFVKRLTKRTPTKLVVTQYSPARTLEFAHDRIGEVHRVLSTKDLSGI